MTDKICYDAITEEIYSLTTDQLEDLQDLIRCTIKARKNERVASLKEKAINAMKDYYNAGGGFYDDDNGCLIFIVDDDHNINDDYYHIHLR